MLDPLVSEGYRKAARLTPDVAEGYLARAGRHLRADNAEAAWTDLLSAEALNTGAPAAVRLRQSLTRLGLAECRAALEAGHPLHVIETADRLRDRSVRTPELDQLVSAAEDWILAAEQADRGDFLLARDTLARAANFLAPPVVDGIQRFAADLERRHETFRVSVAQLTEAADERRWREVVKWADDALAVAPHHREVRELRARGWDAVQPAPTVAYNGDGTDPEIPLTPVVVEASLTTSTRTYPPVKKKSSRHVTIATTTVSSNGSQPLPKRFLLWIDGVGGYLVCLNPRVTFGQAVGDSPVDVPLFADLSRLHAELYRDGEGYVLESAREVLVNGTSVPRTVLRPGDRVTLGPTCQFQFHLPVPVSPTARLELVSGHRLPLAVDGVLLMADTLVLGPGAQSHVTLPLDDVLASIVLFRGKDGLSVRCPGTFKVDNRPCQDRADLPLPGVVTADRFTFAVEPVGPRL